jgi:hypothetical protein
MELFTFNTHKRRKALDMGSKEKPGNFNFYVRQCILLGRDTFAPEPELVEAWATERQRQIDGGSRPRSDQAMVDEAIACAASMRHWRVVNNGSWRK